MQFVLLNALVAGLTFAGVLVAVRIGARAPIFESERARGSIPVLNAIDGIVYALLGLLVAFTFSGALERFTARRALIVEESNAVGTAWSRVDLLGDARQSGMRDLLRRYVDARIETSARLGGGDDAASRANAAALQRDIWTSACAWSGEGAHPTCGLLLLPALNAMFDIASVRLAAHESHPPLTVYAMLIALALLSGVLTGIGLGEFDMRHRLHVVIYAGVVAAVLFVIIDIEYPRAGLIRVDGADELLVAARSNMK